MVMFMDEELDVCFDDAVKLIMDTQKVSASLMQRRLKLGYARAARLLDQLEKAGIVGPADGARPRQILIGRDDYVRPKVVAEEKPEIPSLMWRKIEPDEIDSSILKKYLAEKDGFKVLLGQNKKGRMVTLDLEKYGSLLISGSQLTKANDLLNQILMAATAKWSDEEMKFVLADGMMDDLVFPDRSGHLLTPLIIDQEKVISSLKWLVCEIEHRQKVFKEDLTAKLPKILVMINGLAEMYYFSPSEMSDNIYRILRFGRKYGIYLIMSTDWVDANRFKEITLANPAKVIFRPPDNRLRDKNAPEASKLTKPNQAILWRMFEDNVEFEVGQIDVVKIYQLIFN